MQYPFSITNNNITVFVGGRPLIVTSTDVGFQRLKEHLKGDHDYDTIISLADQRATINKESMGKVTITGDSVFYEGQPAHGAVVDKLLAMRDAGFPIKPWVLFMEKLMANPDARSRDALYTFLEHFQTPITPDGDFLAFKRVRHDFMDIHSGQHDNYPGKIVEMPRDEVDHDSNISCSRGLHACADSYLGHFYANDNNSKVVVVRISPTDVCAVPKDYNFSKMRVCKYEVLSEAEEKDVNTISQSHYSTFGQPEPKVEFKVGDRVRIIGNSSPTHHYPLGDTATILGVTAPNVYDLQSDKLHFGQSVSAKDLELVSDPMDNYESSWDDYDDDYYDSYDSY